MNERRIVRIMSLYLCESIDTLSGIRYSTNIEYSRASLVGYVRDISTEMRYICKIILLGDGGAS